jgi:ribosome biogenesis GTPase
MKKLSKEALGWRHSRNSEIENYHQDWQIARVSIENKNNYQVIIPERGSFPAECTGRILYSAEDPSELPKTGDWVLVQVFEGEQKAYIMQRLSREKCISRNAAGSKTQEQLIAANVDIALIVQGLDQNYNLNRIIRTSVMVRDQGIADLVVLNKMDLVPQAQAYLDAVKAALPTTPCLAISVGQNQGIEQVKSAIPEGTTAVLIGSSGVGKSSLMNRLLEEELLSTGSVRDNDAKGRHTTTRREMHQIPNGGLIIDNPGMRELQLWSAESGIERSLEQIPEIAKACKFKDCSHQSEPGCAVLKALEEHQISPEVYTNFLKLRAEEEYHRSRVDQKSYLEKKADDKRLHKHIRAINRNRDKP